MHVYIHAMCISLISIKINYVISSFHDIILPFHNVILRSIPVLMN